MDNKYILVKKEQKFKFLKKFKKDNYKTIEVEGNSIKRKPFEKLEDFVKRAIGETNLEFKSENIVKISEPEYKKIKNIKTASKSLKSKISGTKVASLLFAGMMFASVLTGCAKNDDKADLGVAKVTAEVDNDTYSINEEDENLRRCYEELLKYNDGEEIVKWLENIDDTSARINKVAIENPDANGKVSIVYAEELAAIGDVYNSNTTQKTVLENETEIQCNYKSGQAALINLSQGSRDVQEIDNLFANKELGTKQQEIQEATQETLDNLNIATPEFIEMLDDIYKTRGNNPELQAEVAFGQAGLAAAITPQMTGETLDNYLYASKTEGGQLNELVNDAAKDSKRFAVENNEINIEKQQDINEALKAIDAKHKLHEYDRTDFNPATTEKGKEMIVALLGNAGITAGGEVVVRNETTNSYEQGSREDAIRALNESGQNGEEIISQLEETVKIDTNNDGINDTPMNVANQNSQAQAQERAGTWAEGYEAGQWAFVNSQSSTPSSDKSQDYKDGFIAGYAHAKSVYEQQSQNDYQEETFVYEQNTTQNTQPETKQNISQPTVIETQPEITQNISQPTVTETIQSEIIYEETFVYEEPQTVMMVQNLEGDVTYQAQETSTNVRSYGAQ